MEIGWQQTKLLQKLSGLLFLTHPVRIFKNIETFLYFAARSVRMGNF